MHELDDNDLLRQYVAQNSEAAFATLVTRHLNKVYSVALRHTRNAHAAEEITQAVFVILAKKSGRLGGKVILSGWLYETARLTAMTFIRGEIRRARREQEAHMQTILNEDESAAWPHIAPLLDDALAGLNAADRHAIVLRYFDGKSLGEVGAALGASEAAVKKRVQRAVEKLRGFFTKRGVTLTATVLTAAISANSVQAAPVDLAATITATAAKGSLISATITTLVKGTMKTMTWLKIKFAAGVGVVALLAGGVVTVAVSQTAGKSSVTAADQAAQQQVLIKSAFVRVPNSQVEKLLSAVKASGTLDPTSKPFRDAVKNCPSAVLISSPSIVTLPGQQAIASVTEDVAVGGKQVPVGTTLAVTPEVQQGGQLTLKLAMEFSELVTSATPSIRSTKLEETLIPLKSGETLIMLRCPVGSLGKNLKPVPGSPEETLLVFATATLTDKFGNRIQR